MAGFFRGIVGLHAGEANLADAGYIAAGGFNIQRDEAEAALWHAIGMRECRSGRGADGLRRTLVRCSPLQLLVLLTSRTLIVLAFDLAMARQLLDPPVVELLAVPVVKACGDGAAPHLQAGRAMARIVSAQTIR